MELGVGLSMVPGLPGWRGEVSVTGNKIFIDLIWLIINLNLSIILLQCLNIMSTDGTDVKSL